MARVGIVLFVGAVALCGQQAVSLTGKVVDPSGAIIPLVKVELVSAGSEEVVATARSGPDGRFLISAPRPDEYILRFRTTGFKDRRVNVGKPANVFDLGNIVLEVFLYDEGSPLVPTIWFPVAEPIDPIKRSVCELAQNPNRFVNTEVTIETFVAPFGLDTSPHLFGHDCSALQLSFGPVNTEVTHDWSYRRLEESLRQCRSVTATLVGRLELTLAVGQEPGHAFRIEAVLDMEAGPRSGIVIKSKKGIQPGDCH